MSGESRNLKLKRPSLTTGSVNSFITMNDFTAVKLQSTTRYVISGSTTTEITRRSAFATFGAVSMRYVSYITDNNSHAIL